MTTLKVQKPSRWVLARKKIFALLFIFIILGVGTRFLRLGLAFPIWGDEAFVAINLSTNDYSELTKPLRHYQIAPLGFLWLEKTALILFGSSEIALRILPCFASILALFIFGYASRSLCFRKTALLAFAILAVSYYPLRHANEIKPYAFDLLAGTIFLLVGTKAIQDYQAAKTILLLTFLTPLLLFISFPAVFVAGGVCIALFFNIILQKKTRLLLTWILFALSILASFLTHYLTIGQNQFQNNLANHQAYWNTAFPPANLLQFPGWFLNVHVGNMFAYPIGGKDGASTVTFLLCLFGIYQLLKKSKYSILLLLLVPFLLNLIAAFLGHYPYGGSARIAQHLAPAICLLMAIGLRSLLQFRIVSKFRSTTFITILLMLALLGISQGVKDIQKPYKTLGDKEARTLIQTVCANIKPENPLLITQEPDLIDPTLEWYLRVEKAKVLWTQEAQVPQIINEKKQADWLWLPQRKPGGDTQPELIITNFVELNSTIKKEFFFSLGRDSKVKPQAVWVQLQSKIRQKE